MTKIVLDRGGLDETLNEVLAELTGLYAEVKRLRAMLPAQYSAGFRDGVQAARPLDAAAPFVVGSDAG
jgi:hypothetical protein